MKNLSPQSYLILGLLLEGEKHGYEIHQSRLLGIWGIPMSQLYSLLKRLEKEGMIRARMAFQENRPGKKVYALTEEGRKSFLGWVQHPCEKIRNIRTEFLAKLYIIHRLRLGIGRRLVEEQIGVCRRRREKLRGETHKADSFETLIQRYRLTMIDATIHWLKTCKDTFEGMKDV